jgi:hypothetical protein
VLWGHNDTPFGRPTPSRPIGHPWVGHPQGVFGDLGFYQLVMMFFNVVPLIMEFTMGSGFFRFYCEQLLELSVSDAKD